MDLNLPSSHGRFGSLGGILVWAAGEVVQLVQQGVQGEGCQVVLPLSQEQRNALRTPGLAAAIG